MKEDIHPKYDLVLFKDGLTGTVFLSRSTMTSREKVRHTDGGEYPLITLDITRYSHPFYTGQQKFVDAAGRIEKFNKKYKK